ncbi:MAG: ANTAR domain-containing protein, partial [Pseudobutyrivibrio sp.]|nr:ANTAR domain-containing protein [Pseudobutyrivibrio sp.]
IDIASKNLCQVILFVKEEIFEATLEAVEKYGILTIAKPVNRQMFWAAIKMSKALTVRMSIANDKIRRLQIKLDETKLVSQAKCLLIANKGLSEEEAHRYIEKQAMDQRTSRVAIADSIVDFYKED